MCVCVSVLCVLCKKLTKIKELCEPQSIDDGTSHDSAFNGRRAFGIKVKDYASCAGEHVNNGSRSS